MKKRTRDVHFHSLHTHTMHAIYTYIFTRTRISDYTSRTSSIVSPSFLYHFVNSTAAMPAKGNTTTAVWGSMRVPAATTAGKTAKLELYSAEAAEGDASLWSATACAAPSPISASLKHTMPCRGWEILKMPWCKTIKALWMGANVSEHLQRRGNTPGA